MKILHIDSSILGDHSVSRKLSYLLVSRLKKLYLISEVFYRDLAVEDVMHLSGKHVANRHGKDVKEQGIRDDINLSDQYFNEFCKADIIVIGAPMYNFSISSQLKSWIDRILVSGKSFDYDQQGNIRHLLPLSKKIFIISTRGGIYEENDGYDHQENYLKSVFSFIGLNDFNVIRAQGLSLGEFSRISSIERAENEISDIDD